MRKVKQADVHSWPLLDTGRSLLYRKRFEKHTKLNPGVHRNLSNIARVLFALSEEHKRAQVARKRGNNFLGGVSTIGLLSDKTDNYVRSTVTSLVSDLVNMKDWADRTCTPMCSLQNFSIPPASQPPSSRRSLQVRGLELTGWGLTQAIVSWLAHFYPGGVNTGVQHK